MNPEEEYYLQSKHAALERTRLRNLSIQKLQHTSVYVPGFCH